MGDIADWLLDSALDFCEDGDYGPPRNPRHNAYGPPLACKHCGARGLYWQRVQGVYRIHDRATLAPHDCRQTPAPDTFEVVPE